MSLLVCETFTSLLGEGTRAGLPAFFIRLAGCNLRCSYCDTAYAYEGGERRTVAALVQEARETGQQRVLVTGGEPLLQEETPALLEELLREGLEVLLETNGSLSLQHLSPRVLRILDLKTPGSGMSRHNFWPNLEFLTSRDEVKFVITGREDFVWVLDVLRDYRLHERLPVLISPAFGLLPPARAAAWIVESRLPLRLNLQLHKYIWGPEARGV